MTNAGLPRLYDYLPSGNCYKVRLLLSQLGLPFERVHLDVRTGETRTAAYAAKNPNMKVPLVEWPDGRRLSESGAILWHFAEGTPLVPADRWDRACVLQWMFFEQYSHEPYIAVVRAWHLFGLVEANRDTLAEKKKRGYHALRVMEEHLSAHPFLAAQRYTIADIALYAYTHVAQEGGFDLSRFTGINAWLRRVAGQPGHIGIADQPGRLVAWP